MEGARNTVAHSHSGVSLESSGSGMPLTRKRWFRVGLPLPLQPHPPTPLKAPNHREKLCWDPAKPGMSPHPQLRCWGTAGRVRPQGLGVVPTVQSRPSACLWGGHGAPCCCIAPRSPHRCTARGSAGSVGSCSPRCLWKTHTA